jgi:hypothetical protein
VVCGVDHVEEVDTVRQISLCPLLGEEFCQLRLLHYISNEIYDTKLIILGDLNGTNLCVGDEVLATSENFLEEVFCNLLWRWEVVLYYILLTIKKDDITMEAEVLIYITLTPEPGNEVPCIEPALLLLLLLGHPKDRLGLRHLRICRHWSSKLNFNNNVVLP